MDLLNKDTGRNCYCIRQRNKSNNSKIAQSITINMSIGPTGAFWDAFTSLAEHSFESADRLIRLNVSTSTSTLNEIPVNASTKYPPAPAERSVAERDRQALGDRKDVIFVVPSSHEVLI